MCELPVEIWHDIADNLVQSRDYCALMCTNWSLYNALNTQKYAHKCRFAPNILQIRSMKQRVYRLIYNYRLVSGELTYQRVTKWQDAIMTRLNCEYYILYRVGSNSLVREFSNCIAIRGVCGGLVDKN